MHPDLAHIAHGRSPKSQRYANKKGDFGTQETHASPASVHLWLCESVRIDVIESGLGALDVPLFDLNQVRLRGELRAGFGVLRPRGIVEIDLTP